MSTMILIPAYYRMYADHASLLAAWERGEDFKILNGPYTSIRDMDTLRSYDLPLALMCGTVIVEIN